MCPQGEGTAPSDRTKYCTRCGTKMPASSNFCPQCGQAQNAPAPPPVAAPPYYAPYAPPPTFSVRDLGRAVGSWGALALFILSAVNVVIMLGYIPQVYPHLNMHTTLYVITPFIIGLYDLGGGISFLLWYIFLAVAITASFLWMTRKSYRPLAEELRGREPKGGHSPLYLIATVFMAVIAFNLIFNLLVMSGGASPSTPDFQDEQVWQLIYGFAHAAVWEEIIARILLIGIPLLIVDYAITSGDRSKGMKKLHRYFLGGGFAMGRKEAFFLAFSSAIFGMAHVFNWDLYKVLPAIVGGLAFGYLFLKLGLYASVTLHFIIDFLSIPTDVFPDSNALAWAIALLTIFWVIVGVPYLIRYAARGLGWFTKKKMWPDVPAEAQPVSAYPGGYQYPPPYPAQAPYPPQPYQPPQYQWPQPPRGPAGAPPAPAPPPVATPPPGPRDPTAIGFVCPHCGNTEATYKDGKLICTKCGKS